MMMMMIIVITKYGSLKNSLNLSENCQDDS